VTGRTESAALSINHSLPTLYVVLDNLHVGGTPPGRPPHKKYRHATLPEEAGGSTRVTGAAGA